jgi:inhibitor of KinA sporulation pathway (predicted exonuclease)
VIDFECTCERDASDFPHEIIEFPVVVVDRRDMVVVAEFQSYCRPVLNPVLSEFCTELTGITQAQVARSACFEI